MASPVKPFAKCVYVCDDVVRDYSTGKVILVNLWDAIRVPTHGRFPFCLAKLCVFVWWRDGSVKVKSRIDIVQASTGRLICRTIDCILNFENRTETVFARYKMENCTFDEPGYYFVEVFCEGEFVDDQIIRVICP